MPTVPILPINLTEVLAVVLGCMMVLIPITGLTARFALKPIAEALAKLREAESTNQAVVMLERRMELLEQEIHSVSALRDDVGRLVEAQEFHLKLAGSPEAARRAAE